jgi:3',5'-cyclic AMP phosphodiesterase CpdA
MFRLAHVSDPHFRGPGGFRVRDLISKRAIGVANVLLNRRRKHRMELLESLAGDLRSERLDHVAVTGDLSNVSLSGEWQAALRWLEGLGRPSPSVTVIPGNHDVYVQDAVGAFERLFGAYQRADAASLNDDAGYPFVQVRGRVALVGVNSCVPTGDFGAWGEIGREQLAALALRLAAPELADKTRVVLLHHPPVKLKGGEDRNLRDREAFANVLAEAGADLVLHGHDHRDESASLVGPGGRAIPVVGAGSASYAGHGSEGGPRAGRARYNIYEIDGPRIEMITRAHDEATGAFCEAQRVRLA